MTVTQTLFLTTVLYALLFGFGCLFAFDKKALPSCGLQSRKGQYIGVFGLCAVFVLQLCVTAFMPGHVQDSSLFRLWTSMAEEHPIWEYYTTDAYVDYPPVYLYVLFAVGKLAKLFGVDSQSAYYMVCVRFVPILFDALTTLCLYGFARERVGEQKAFLPAFLSAVNPAKLLNSTVWGQIDSVTSFMAAAMLLLLYKKQYVGGCALFMLSFLTKPQMILFAPIFGFVFLADIVAAWPQPVQRRYMLKQALLSILGAAAVLLLVPLPITGGHYGLLIEKYRSALGLYPYATLNAANLFGALGANWVKDGETLFLFSYKTWGYIGIVILSVMVGIISFKQRDRRHIFYMGVWMVAGVFMLSHNMHERYLQPVLLLLAATYIISGDAKSLLFYGGFSLTNYLCCGRVLILNQQDAFIYGNDLQFRLLSACNVLLFVLWIWYVVRQKPLSARHTAPKAMKRLPLQMFAEKKVGLHTDSSTTHVGDVKPLLRPSGQAVRLSRPDCWIMLTLTVFYAVFGFWHLGSRNVPESGCYIETAGESLVLDLGDVCNAKQLYAYTGWIDRRRSDQEVLRDITVAYSADGENFIESEQSFELKSIFHWHVFRDLPEACRYIRLTCDDGRFYLNELAVFGETEAESYPIVNVQSENPTAACVFDEPNKVTYEFSWYEDTYFDEIYHPRTAYEFITHRYPYENTHPPLGKCIIACGMLLFGVNPFGWRFFGTLCGVLMVPLVYIMAKKMLKQTRYAAFAAFLFSFDFMHLAQTRLATIDSYTAFFVMGMYVFMFLYIERNFYETGVKKTLWPLLGSGICFGLGAATKWQGIYAGAGLAVLFFYNLYCRYAEYKEAKKNPNREGAAKIIVTFRSNAIQTVAAGFLFFVVIPGVIYFLSYIPAMMSESTGLSFFFTNQGSMFRYHSQLKEPHSYGSSWWQWPLDYKPLYAYNPNRDFVPKGTSMGITSFGNPLIWWTTIPIVIWSLCRLRKQRGRLDLGLLTAVVGFFSLYVPWIFVTRTAFIYHFFPCVVFVVLMLCFFLRDWEQKKPKRRRWVYGYLAAVFILFVAYYPVLTGIAVPTAYAGLLRLIPGWVLG